LFAALGAGQDRLVAAPFGPGVVFLNVLAEQLGLPVPVVPTLVVAGALAAAGRLPGTLVFALSLLACLIGDGSWYVAGRRYGGRVMKLLCRISLTPDVCVNDTQAIFERYGPAALVVAKFVPGLSLVAPPLAGAMRMSLLRFALFSLLGSALWVGAALAAGALLRRQIEQLLPRLAGIGGTALLLLLVLLGAYVAFKWWERRRFYAALELARIEVAELHERLNCAPAPLIVDVRNATAQSLERRRIPGALHVPLTDIERQLANLPREREIIFYCTCPNEASAAQAARLLQNLGFARVRPLRGGLDAWIAAGYAIEELTPDLPENAQPRPPNPAAGG
jgi:membrane protein DedA with SNARE-associated domain/rhodanese-related sulfurtransferase